jgi:hypothetical protein
MSVFNNELYDSNVAALVNDTSVLLDSVTLLQSELISLQTEIASVGSVIQTSANTTDINAGQAVTLKTINVATAGTYLFTINVELSVDMVTQGNAITNFTITPVVNNVEFLDNQLFFGSGNNLSEYDTASLYGVMVLQELPANSVVKVIVYQDNWNNVQGTLTRNYFNLCKIGDVNYA